MQITARFGLCGLLATVSLIASAATAVSGPLPARAFVSDDAGTISIEVGRRWYRELEESRYPPNFYVPPPRGWWRARGPRGVYLYEPRVYGWSYPPPPPVSCGQYRYWNGDYCADARREPPYVGPR
ncbi:MAG: hypothetical protein J0H65_15355 [Rhizobiales bacterium]|nr:hypothetical protein [Hyphomicrobiales bacterium]